MTLGRVLTLVIVVDDHQAEEIIEAANDASRQHPCRIVVVVAGNRRGSARMDAQIRLGGDAGASEVVIMRLYGELAKHGQSVVVPLLLADSPVVAWWPHEFPADLRTDPIAQMAQRRITDSAESRNPREALKRLATQYEPGDTDLAWTRVTLWRGLLAAALDGPPYEAVTEAVVAGASDSPSTELLAAWLGLALKAPVRRVRTKARRRGGQRPAGAQERADRPGPPGRRGRDAVAARSAGPADLAASAAGSPSASPTSCATSTTTTCMRRRSPAVSRRCGRLGRPPRRPRSAARRRRRAGLGKLAAKLARSAQRRGGAGHGGGAAATGRGRHAAVKKATARKRAGEPTAAGEGGRQAAREEGDAQEVHVMTGAEPTVEVHPSKQSLSDAAAARFLAAVRDAAGDARRGPGGADRRVDGVGDLRVAAPTPGRDEVDWSQVYVWWGDERYLPAGDPDRNDTQNDEAALLAARAGRRQGLPGRGPGRQRERRGERRGVRDDRSASSGRASSTWCCSASARTATWRPCSRTTRRSASTDAVAVAVHDSPKPPPDRVSLTFDCLNRTREVWFLVAGADKADAVAAALRRSDRWDVPASGVRGSVATRWLLDERPRQPGCRPRSRRRRSGAACITAAPGYTVAADPARRADRPRARADIEVCAGPGVRLE